jgi:PPK2 family polyphosphate:nucleotide phosphotransferase
MSPPVNLRSIDPNETGGSSKDAAQSELDACKNRIAELQYLLYAEGEHSLLICLQALDAGGKDGVIRHVFSALNPQGATVINFKVPTRVEADHDFLWRYHRAVPARGQVAIFNRSHYEDVLVTRVHKLVPEKVWSKRYDDINAFEALLHKQGTQILKFYLHIDPDEQLRRFEKRLDDPTRQWKVNEDDYEKRKHWNEYIRAYEDAITKCSPDWAPWFVIPANHKWFRDLAVARIVVKTLESLHMKFPKPTADIAALKRKHHAKAT